MMISVNGPAANDPLRLAAAFLDAPFVAEGWGAGTRS
jgi:hypothetical protein